MATITKPMALDESFKTTESTSRNQADVLAGIEEAIRQGFGQVASAVEYDNTDSGLTADNVQDAIDELAEDKADTSEVTEVDTTNTTPFLYRQTPHNADGVFLDELVGGSVAWNQLVQNGNFADDSGWANSNATFSISNNIATITASAKWGMIIKSVGFIQAHKYLAFATIKGSTKNYLALGNDYLKYLTKNNEWETVSICAVGKATANDYYQIGDSASSDWTAFQVKDCMLIDLTQMFGTTIADYIYSLEQATAESGIEWLKSYGFFTKDYYAYNTGTLESVNPSGKKVVGFNQWDEEWELGNLSVSNGSKVSSNTNIRSKNYIPVIGGETYYFKNYQLRMPACYDENKTFISAADATAVGSSGWLLTMPENAKYMRFDMSNNYGTTYNHDICINISKTEGTPKNGDYVPYEEHTYDISNIDLRGIPKLINNELVYDGDTYESNGDVTRKYGIVDLGELTWNKNDATSSDTAFFHATLPTQAKYDSTNVNTVICGKYVASLVGYSTTTDKAIYLDSATVIRVMDKSYSTASDFKTAMSGVYLVYELATPTTETADPYTSPQICDKNGTEEFIDDRTVPIPVGHNSRYADLPAIMDGDYLSYMARNFASFANEEIVKYTISGNTADLIPIVIDGTAHNNIPIVTDITKYRMLCVELVLKPSTAITGVYFSAIAFTDGIYLPSGISVPVYIPSENFYANVTINPDGNGGFKLSYTAINQSQSTPPDYYSIRVRAFNQY